MDQDDFTIGELRRRDVAAAISMLNREILTGINTFLIEPIDQAGAERWWRDRASGQYPAIGAWNSQQTLVGWAAVSKWSAYEGYARTAEVSVWVDPDYQGRGLGTRLMERLIERAGELEFGVLLARIEANNRASIRLHERLGFAQIGTMHRVGEKFGRLLDVVILEKEVAGR